MNLAQQLDRNSEMFVRIAVNLLQNGYALRFTAQGTSMKPLLREGDIVLIDPIGNLKPKPSEIVFFLNEQGDLVLHRVLKRWRKGEKLFYLLKGDQVSTSDGIFENDRIIGRLRGIERPGYSLSTNDLVFKTLNYLAYLRSLTGIASRNKIALLLTKSKHFAKYLKD